MNDDFFSQIFLDLQNRISKEVPEISFIDQDLGQLGQVGEDNRPPLSYPALLIDFPDTQYSNLATDAQLGNVPISFQLIFDTYSQTWQKSPLPVKTKGLEYLRIEQKLHKCLQGWNLDYFTKLCRVRAQSQNNNDIGLRVRNITYVTEYEDYSLDNDEYREIEFDFKGSLKVN